MNIVASVFGTMKEMYRGLNPATLSGAIDVIVVRQPDGSFQCSPFHVRFGKLGVLRSKEKVVDIEINGEPVDLHMKLGDNGEAFFVEENEDLECEVPAHLCTSPIPRELEEQQEPVEGATASGGRRRKRRKKRFRSDCHPRDESSSEGREESSSPALHRSSPALYGSNSALDGSSSALQSRYGLMPATQDAGDEIVFGQQRAEAAEEESGTPSAPVENADVVIAEPGVEEGDDGEHNQVQDDNSSKKPAHGQNSGIDSALKEKIPWISAAEDCEREFSTLGRIKTKSRSSLSTKMLENLMLLELKVQISLMVLTLSLKSIYFSMCEELEQPREAHAHSDSEQTPHQHVFLSRPSSPKSDSELCVGPRGSSGPEIQWNWGGFPTPCQSQRSPVHVCLPSAPAAHFRTIERQDSFDLGLAPPLTSGVRPGRVTVVRPKARTRSLDLNNCSFRPLHPLCKPENTPLNEAAVSTFSSGVSDAAQSNGAVRSDETAGDCAESKWENALIGKDGQSVASVDGQDEERLRGAAQSGQIGEDGRERGKEPDSYSDPAADAEEGEELNATAASGNAPRSEEKKKEKRSHHLGTSDIYLDDLTSMDPEVAVLYFPKTGKESSPPLGAHSLSGSLSPQSVGSGTLDSGTDYLSDSMSFSANVSLSLCGPGTSSAISKEKFMERIVMYQDLSDSPGLIDDPNLVVCINSNYYNWAVAGPMVLAMAAFQKNLPKSTVEQLVKQKMSKKSGRWWFPFRRRDLPNSPNDSKEDPDEPVSSGPLPVQATLDDVDSDEVAGLGRFASLPSSLSSDDMSMTQSFSQMYRKSLRLTSEQIERLNLCEGENLAVFSVTTQYQGTCRCEASIFLWSWDDHVVISDIDGTITKSDALGHLLTTIGADWTHSGIAKLYHRIHQNGYRLLYCSARAIGMSAWTKEYLSRVKDRGAALPKGPVLLAPSSLVSALHREVIEKKPEVFKVACLSDIRDLFNPHREPFYAAFGNRTNDAFAYKAVGVPETRLFTVNPRGELTQEKTRSNKSSYTHLCELVEYFFPSLFIGSEVLDCPDFSSATYWKEPLPPLDLDELL
ncbi:phosphatidate phosphatase LPIN3 [Eucyclogobius newberryi]|uniref:phosphatidate phosphatase LPIN3 n=1 Tax=Eucyclogobius newberryi TaxID=166745 RepID=UPI003B5AF900